MILENSPFAIGVYRIEASVETELKLPDHAGSILRGIFGHFLKRISCMTDIKDCGLCPLQLTCPYPALFEMPVPDQHRKRGIKVAPSPYVIVPPPWGTRQVSANQHLVFHMHLFGIANNRLPFIIHAWNGALARGLGRDRVRAHLRYFFLESRNGRVPVYDSDDGRVENHVVHPVAIHSHGEEAKDWILTFETPYRTQENGKPLGVDAINPRRLINDIVRRARLLANYHGNLRDDSGIFEDNPLKNWPVDSWLNLADTIEHEKNLYWQDWRRYSGRQKQGMYLGGLMGRWIWHSVPVELLSLLRLAHHMHVGKQTVFGFGKIRMDPLASLSASS